MAEAFKRQAAIIREVVATRLGVPSQVLRLTRQGSQAERDAARIAAYIAFQALPVSVCELSGLFSADTTRTRLALLRVREKGERDGAFSAKLAELQEAVARRLDA